MVGNAITALDVCDSRATALYKSAFEIVQTSLGDNCTTGTTESWIMKNLEYTIIKWFLIFLVPKLPPTPIPTSSLCSLQYTALTTIINTTHSTYQSALETTITSASNTDLQESNNFQALLTSLNSNQSCTDMVAELYSSSIVRKRFLQCVAGVASEEISKFNAIVQELHVLLSSTLQCDTFVSFIIYQYPF